MTITDAYEKSIVNLALRTYAHEQFEKAETEFRALRVANGDEAMERGREATKIANRLEAEG